jgi:hypothetical protein
VSWDLQLGFNPAFKRLIQNWGGKIFSDLQLVMRIHIKIIIMVLE